MASKVKVTVIVPVHNTSEYLPECLNSLVSQPEPWIEFLCIDDGSTDDSPQILRSYAKYDDRFRIVRQENQGVGPARNRGIEEARGEFVAFLDSDDTCPNSNTIRNLWESASKNEVLIAGGSFSERHGSWVRTSWDGIYRGYAFEFDGLMDYRDYQFDYGYHRFIYAAELLRQNGIVFPPYLRFQDPPFFVRAMTLAERFYALVEPTYCYRFGHQLLDWNPRRTHDLVCGLRDNLAWAERFGYEDLRELTWYRLTNEYRDRIVDRLRAGDLDVTERLHECQDLAPSAPGLPQRLADMLAECRQAGSGEVAGTAGTLTVERSERAGLA